MKLLKTFWLRLKTPSKVAVGLVLFMGFIGGLLFWGGFNTVMEKTNTEEFCAGCHAPIVKEIPMAKAAPNMPSLGIPY